MRHAHGLLVPAIDGTNRLAYVPVSGQRRPTPAEAADLLWSGLVAHLRPGVRGLRDMRWRDAAGVAGLLAATVPAAIALRRMSLHMWMVWPADTPDQPRTLLWDVQIRALGWLLVVIVLFAGLRRTGAALAVVATAGEIAMIGSWSDEWRWVAMGRLLVLAPLIALLLVVVRRARKPVLLLGRWGALTSVGGIMLAGAVAGEPWQTRPPWLPLFGYPVAAVVLPAGLRRLDAGVRRPVLVLLATLPAVLFAQTWFAEAAAVPVLAAVTVLGGFVLRDKLPRFAGR
ncbi:hypothetical protein AB0J80_30085 [Actinoplanes sp. NPDC049548]|uniref:hypothetical protein n=1 Tax=Actinoplanes sp. NPDC049548 TaxID=3155152 RepID=UPI00344801C3